MASFHCCYGKDADFYQLMTWPDFSCTHQVNLILDVVLQRPPEGEGTPGIGGNPISRVVPAYSQHPCFSMWTLNSAGLQMEEARIRLEHEGSRGLVRRQRTSKWTAIDPGDL